MLVKRSGFKFAKLLFICKRSFADRAYVHCVGKEPLIYRNLGEQLLRYADVYGNRTALIACEENLELTYADVRHEAEKLAVQLKEMGLKKGEHMGLWAPNTSQWYIAFLAGVIGGFPIVCLNPALQAPEMEYSLNKSRIKILITTSECGKLQFSKILDELFRDGKTKFPHLNYVLMKGLSPKTEGDEIYNYDSLLEKPVNSTKVNDLYEKLKEISPEFPCNLQFTSGTTGKPKATILTHFNILNETYYLGKSLFLHESQKRICFIVPFFHAYGLSVAVSASQYGSTLVLPSPVFNASKALDSVEKQKCNLILGTPTMYVDLLEQQRLRPRCVESLDIGVVGGAACSPEVFMQTKRDFSLKEMRIAYGSTEMSAGMFAHDGSEPLEEAVLSVGKLFEHGEAKVINEQGETVEFGVSGELCIRGYSVMKGYYDDEARTKEVLSFDGWLKTGDEFILEATGVGRLIGRKKDMIIRGGENIYPKEIEDVLDTHQSILESQVVGVPDKRLGEEVCVFLRLKPGVEHLTSEDIASFCKNKLAYFKIPKYVRIIDEFPKTNSGKIQKFKLKDLF